MNKLSNKSNISLAKTALFVTAISICSFSFAETSRLELNSNGDLVATTTNSMITVSQDGLVDVNGLTAECDGGIARKTSPNGAKINCVSSAINIHDHLGNQLKIAGSLAKFELANGEVLTKNGWALIDEADSASSDLEDLQAANQAEEDDQKIEINKGGIKVRDSDQSITIDEDGIKIE